jgi:hypothetical protein
MNNNLKWIIFLVLILIFIGGIIFIFSEPVVNNVNNSSNNQSKTAEDNIMNNNSSNNIRNNSISNDSKSVLKNSTISKNSIKKNQNPKNNYSTTLSKKEAYLILKNKYNKGNYKVDYNTGKFYDDGEMKYWAFLIYDDSYSDTQGSYVYIDIETKQTWGSG